MLILGIHVLAFLLCIAVIKKLSWDTIPGCVCFILAICIGASFVACIALYIGAHMRFNERDARIKLEEQYKTINYILENDKIPGSDIIEQVTEYNSTILTKRYYNSISLLEPYTFDFYDELPLVELE